MRTRYSPVDNPYSETDGNAGTTVDDGSSLSTAGLLPPPRSLLSRMPRPIRPQLKIVILGPSLTHSTGNGAAATYRGLIRELTARGHDVLFLQRGSEKSNASRDLRKPVSGRLEEYSSLRELKDRHAAAVREGDFVLVASHIHEAVEIGDWVTRHAQGATAFYDLDTPATLADLAAGKAGYISAELIPRYSLYLSFTGGRILEYLEEEYNAPKARALYPSVDARFFYPEHAQTHWDLGYLGGHSADRQPVLERIFLEPARRWKEGRFVVAGSHYPRSVRWPKNVKRISLVPPAGRRAFYNRLRFALNLAPPETIALGYSPSVRLFEAAACGIPIVTEFWPGLDTFFTLDEEILISHSADETMIYLEEISELDRRRLGYRARERVLARHTSRHRAAELESCILEVLKRSPA
jgi:spore maturation protein CgeB